MRYFPPPWAHLVPLILPFLSPPFEKYYNILNENCLLASTMRIQKSTIDLVGPCEVIIREVERHSSLDNSGSLFLPVSGNMRVISEDLDQKIIAQWIGTSSVIVLMGIKREWGVGDTSREIFKIHFFIRTGYIALKSFCYHISIINLRCFKSGPIEKSSQNLANRVRVSEICHVLKKNANSGLDSH